MQLTFHFCHHFDFIFLAGKEEQRIKQRTIFKINQNLFCMEVTKSEKLTSNTHLKAGDMVSGMSSVNGK